MKGSLGWVTVTILQLLSREEGFLQVIGTD